MNIIKTYMLNNCINIIIHIIINCELMGLHTNLFSSAHYLSEEINNNKNNNTRVVLLINIFLYDKIYL